MNNEETIWLAGLLEGEGSFLFRKGGSPKISCAMTDLDIIEYIQNLVGGKVYAVSRQKEHHKDAWVWILHGKDAIDLMKILLPYMFSRRYNRINEVIDSYTKHHDTIQAKKDEKVRIAKLAAQDYLNGAGSYRDMQKKYGISFVTVKNYVDKLKHSPEM